MNTLPSDLNEQCALQCEGYVRAGVAPNGTVWLHPPGERNRSVPVPAYTDSWDACMRLVWRYGMGVIARQGTERQGKGWVIVADRYGKTRAFSDTETEARHTIIAAALAMEEEATAPLVTTETAP